MVVMTPPLLLSGVHVFVFVHVWCILGGRWEEREA
jgi:hypothetical protein